MHTGLTTAKLVVYGTAYEVRYILHILLPGAVPHSHSFRVRVTLPVSIRLWLPYGVSPHAPVWLAVSSRAEVVAQPRLPSTEYRFRGPGSELLRVEGERHATIVQVGVSCPLRPGWAVAYAVPLVGTEGEIDVGAAVSENVLDAAPCGAMLSVLWPDEGLCGFDVSESTSVLVPAPLARCAIVLCWSVSPSVFNVSEFG
jgi:hypothetical protein